MWVHSMIDFNGFKAVKTLQRALTDSRVDEIEGAGLDDGRVFIHLKRGYTFTLHEAHSCSVGSAADVREALQYIEPCVCALCVD